MYQHILSSVSDNHVATISINRPELGNSMDRDVMLELIDAFLVCSADENVRAIILTGEGKNFSAGGDMNRFKIAIEDGTGVRSETIRTGSELIMTIRNCPKPVVAKINGAAAGAGASLAFVSDFRVMSETSKLVGSFVMLGFPGDTCGWYTLSRLIGMSRTTEFYMLGKPIGGAQAHELGLANRLVASEQLDGAATELAEQLAALPTAAIACQKKMVSLIAYPDLPVLAELETAYMRQCSFAEDHKEAVYAFLEKRKPKFQGK